MNDREVPIPGVEGKTILSMRLIVTDETDTEVVIDFTDGTSFSTTICPRVEMKGELYVGGAGGVQVLSRYGD